MANEISFDADTGLTFFACRFQLDGDVFLTDGASDEVWGTGGRDADDYDIPVTESGSSGHYVGGFDPGGNIALGRYKVVVYEQAGVNPDDSDLPAREKGEILWSGTSEIFDSDLLGIIIVGISAVRDDIASAHETTDALIVSTFTNVFNIYNES